MEDILFLFCNILFYVWFLFFYHDYKMTFLIQIFVIATDVVCVLKRKDIYSIPFYPIFFFFNSRVKNTEKHRRKTNSFKASQLNFCPASNKCPLEIVFFGKGFSSFMCVYGCSAIKLQFKLYDFGKRQSQIKINFIFNSTYTMISSCKNNLIFLVHFCN